MGSSFFYEEREVPADLAGVLQCTWYLRRDALPEHIDTVYPDGCCELIIHLAQPPRARSLDQDWRQQGRCLFAGQMRQGFQLQSEREVICLGFRFKPIASTALGLFNLAASRDRVIEVQSENRKLARRLLAAIDHHPFTDPAWPKLELLWQTLGPVLTPFESDARIERAIERILSANGQETISRLAADLGMSLRSFQQKFRNLVGLTPKEYARIRRLQASLELLDGEQQPLSRVALDAGFSDQAHANRELKRVTGMTPRALQAGLKNRRDDLRTLQMAAAFIRGYSTAAD